MKGEAQGDGDSVGEVLMWAADKRPHIAVFIKSLQGGGAERVMLMLASAFARLGCKVDVLVASRQGHLHEVIPGDVTIHMLTKAGRLRLLFPFLRLAKGNWQAFLKLYFRKIPRIAKALPALNKHLRKSRPDAVLSTLPGANIVAAWAVRLAGSSSSLVLREANQFSAVQHTKDNFGHLLLPLAKRWYPTADAIIAVSEGVREDIVNALQLPTEKTVAILNPVDLQHIRMRAAEALPEDSGLQDGCRFVLAAGKLEPQKDYITLVRAFAMARNRRDTRLVILGEGSLGGKLRTLAEELGISDLVLLPGFVANPYAYMRRATVFVLSSAWEGCPNVLLEALACGCPIVSTDCPSGPKEILANGKYGALVPVRDSAALASGIEMALDGGGIAHVPEAALKDYAIERVACRYLKLFDRAMAGRYLYSTPQVSSR
jgi:glycosyltransferase involved in cell wall biosynthesis